jgi:2-hydroxychromene-2-carboxylate isomerase
MASETLGRLPEAQMEKVLFDAPEATVRAILTKQDEIIEKLNLILVAIEASTDGDTLQTALDTADIKAEIQKIKLFI